MPKLTYRKGVDAIVIDSNNNFLLVQKNVYDNNQWAFPGGGVEEGESLESAILRELKEELGTTNFEILSLSPVKNIFEWPKENRDWAYAKYGKRWAGQQKQQFIVKFTGTKKEIVLNNNELKRYKWVKYQDLEKHLVFDGQWENAKKVINNKN